MLLNSFTGSWYYWAPRGKSLWSSGSEF